jgi:excisionase family DNA binding protein
MMSRGEMRLSSIKQAARELGISVSTLRRDVRLRRVRSVRYGRKILIPVSELHRIERQGLITSEAEMEVA